VYCHRFWPILSAKSIKTFARKGDSMRRKTILALALSFIIGLLLPIATIFTLPRVWYPNYPIVNLLPILSQPALEEADYNTLLTQTGLGKSAVDELFSHHDGKQTLLTHQYHFFNRPAVSLDFLNPITIEKIYTNDQGDTAWGFPLHSIQNGDILITRSTGTFGYNHGHAALVVDAAKGVTLEAFTIGQRSALQDVNHWRRYTSFLLLRPKDTSLEIKDQVTQFSLQNLINRRYFLLAGFKTKMMPIEEMIGTHCSHIVWYPYMLQGIDLDADQGKLVTPKDIANSPLLEIVQYYGFDPIKRWE